MRLHAQTPLKPASRSNALRQPSQTRQRVTLDQRFILFGGMAMLLALACVLPTWLQPEHYHAFADQRSWDGVPHAGDVLSNLGFLLAALAGGWRLLRVDGRQVSTAARSLAALFFVGLACSALGSAYYHWAPVDASLAWDRLGMSVAFAGLLGLAVQTRLDDVSGWLTAGLVLVAAPLSVVVWTHSGNLLPWALLQGGGMLAVVWLTFVPVRKNALPVALGWVIVWYGLAKLLELSDLDIFVASSGWVSGHSLKHWAAACAAWPVLQALYAQRVKQ